MREVIRLVQEPQKALDFEGLEKKERLKMYPLVARLLQR